MKINNNVLAIVRIWQGFSGRNRLNYRVIGPQSDHDFLLLIAILQRVVFCKSRLLRAVLLRLKVLDVYATSIRIGRPRAARIISFAQPAQHL